jgi:hypothetical protein
MDTIKQLVAGGRDRDGTVVDAADRATPYSYHEFCTNTWKAGNLLRHYGVRQGSQLPVLVGPKDASDEGRFGHPDSAAPLIAVLAAATLGAAVDLSPSSPLGGRAAVLPAGWLDRYQTEAGCSRIAYGGPPDDPDVVHFEGQSWSENPIEPPDQVAVETPLLVANGTTFSQGIVKTVAGELRDSYGLGEGSRVALDAPMTEPGAVVAGVVAPLLAGSTVVLDDRQQSQSVDLRVTGDNGGKQTIAAPRITESLRERS